VSEISLITIFSLTIFWDAMFNCSGALITIAAVDFDLLIAFYADLLQISPHPYRPQVYAGFKIAGVELGIFQPKASHVSEFAQQGHGAVSLCLEVDDLNGVLQKLAMAGYQGSLEITMASHGQESYIYDPEGNRIILHQNNAT
jgi:predicted enzyme related to lactoylglutathione lyase